jgi:uncharacterized protein (DUF1684 family)
MQLYNKPISTLRLLIFILILSQCVLSQIQSGADQNYVKEIQAWHQKRITSLTREGGWLSLAGLYWLNDGANQFGADSSNDIIFPTGKAPDYIGILTLENDEITINIKSNVRVLHQGGPIQSLKLKTDAEGESTVLSLGSLSWFIIKRGERYAVRLRDSENPTLKNFKGLETFPIDTSWRIRARVEPYDPPKEIPIPTVLGTTTKDKCPGALVFKIRDQLYRLDPLAEDLNRPLFLIFADKTNGHETYEGGRFLVVEKPDENGTTFIDFNKAYNPPCAFTAYATCPLPPRQNRLPIPVTAGEKKYEDSGH